MILSLIFSQVSTFLQSGDYGAVTIYLRRNWGGEFENVAILVAIAVNEDGYREVLGAAEGMKEDKASWVSFFQWLRSHAERGLEERPTIHEGVAAQALERRGIISDRCELNRQIKADNALLRELKAELKKLASLVAHTVPAVAEYLEKLRGRILIFCYQLSHIRAGQNSCQEALNVYKPQLTRFTNLVQQIKEKSRERKTVKAEKKALPAWQVFKYKELAAKIAELTEDLEELRSEKALLLQQFEYSEAAGAETFRKDIATLESNLQKLDEQEQKYSAELETTLHEYAKVKSQAADLDPAELYEARQSIRPEYEATANEKLEQVFGDKYSPLRWMDAKQAQARLTNDSAEEYTARQMAKQKCKSMLKPTRRREQEHAL